MDSRAETGRPGPDREREILLFECECAAMFSDAFAAARHEAATGHFVSTRRVPESQAFSAPRPDRSDPPESLREPAGRRSGGRVSGRNHRVFEDVGRSWKPEDYATDDHMNLVLEILIEHREVAQNEIVTLLHEELGDRYRLGTVRGIVSASLLYLREAGLVEVAQPSRPTTWRIT